MNKFVALDVTEGDAFFLERDGLTVLVDGGKDEQGFASLVDCRLRCDHIDVVVCTHNDADHANGIVGLLARWRGKVREVWLPGSWSYQVTDLIHQPDDFLSRLSGDLKHLPDDLILLDGEAVPREGELGNLLESGDFVEGADAFRGLPEQPEPDYPGYGFSPRSRERFLMDPPSPVSSVCAHRHVWNEWLDAGERIRKIALLAYHRGARIRWFDFQAFQRHSRPCGGLPGVLEPVNAREVRPRHVPVSPIEYLMLTVANRESLVFLAPESTGNPGVLFTADSDLAFQLPNFAPHRSMIVTVPHHGSETNCGAYGTIEMWHAHPENIVWVRCDGQPKCAPGPTFLASKGRRVCTRCRPWNTGSQRVKLHVTGRGPHWVRSHGVRFCCCQ